MHAIKKGIEKSDEGLYYWDVNYQGTILAEASVVRRTCLFIGIKTICNPTKPKSLTIPIQVTLFFRPFGYEFQWVEMVTIIGL